MVGPALRDGAAQVTPWIAASALFVGPDHLLHPPAFTLGRRTGLLLVAMSIPAAANVGLNLVLIPRFGLTGAMWATTASYGLGLAASIALGRRRDRCRCRWAEALKAGAASLRDGRRGDARCRRSAARWSCWRRPAPARWSTPWRLTRSTSAACGAARGRPCGILRARMAT